MVLSGGCTFTTAELVVASDLTKLMYICMWGPDRWMWFKSLSVYYVCTQAGEPLNQHNIDYGEKVLKIIYMYVCIHICYVYIRVCVCVFTLEVNSSPTIYEEAFSL